MSQSAAAAASGGVESTMACGWLAAYYEIVDGFMLSRMDLYTDYINACATLTMRAVANAVSFANCVR